LRAPSPDKTLHAALEKEIGHPVWNVAYDVNERIIGVNLGGMGLQRWPSALWKLASLEELYLEDNNLTDFPYAISLLPRLRLLDLRGNQIGELPAWILNLPIPVRWFDGALDEGINVFDNPLQAPTPEVLEQGAISLRAYYGSLGGDRLELGEARLLLVGEGSSGKTSLVRALLGEDFRIDESQTRGVSIRHLELQASRQTSLRLRLWDFGGQEIMHATHQFFLSRRSLYVLVLDGRRDEETEYWLKQIQSFGGNSPVLVALNKIDQNPGYDVNRPFLSAKYPAIKGFYRISCRTRDGISDLLEAILAQASHLELVNTVWPQTWFRVRDVVSKMSKPFLSYAAFQSVCKDSGIADTVTQNALTAFLNDLGIALHFPDLELRNAHILQPEWITSAVYRILNSQILATSAGIFCLQDLGDILETRASSVFQYPTSMHGFIVALMRKFELCYRVDQDRVLVPDLLPVQEPVFTVADGPVTRLVVQ
jgi:internalin A